MAAGLASAHIPSVIHVDFKPSTVMVGDGQPLRAVLMDFWFWRWASRGTRQSRLAYSLARGCGEYMAPY